MKHSITVKTFLNEGMGRFWKYESGDLLTPGPTLRLSIDDEAKPDAILGTSVRTMESMEREALDVAWVIGNRELHDDDGQAWPSAVRIHVLRRRARHRRDGVGHRPRRVPRPLPRRRGPVHGPRRHPQRPRLNKPIDKPPDVR